MAAILENISHVGILSVAYLALVATIVGYVLWGRLLARHPASKVAPLSLLVPMLGLISSAWFLDEQLAAVQWLGGLVVMFGLAVNVFGQRLLRGLAGVARGLRENWPRQGLLPCFLFLITGLQNEI